MHEKLRRVKDKLSMKRRDSAHASTQHASTDAETSSQASFLGLPPEIRNVIYEHVAFDTVLSISCTKRRKPPPIVGLLLACRQTWQEYRALMLSQAIILVSVTDYNFSNVIRVFEHMCEADLDLLRANEQLWLLLYIGHTPGQEERGRLRGWCDYRNANDQKPYFGRQRMPKDLLFRYTVRFLNNMRPPRPMSRYLNGYQMKVDLIRTHLRMVTKMLTAERDNPTEELKRMQEDLEIFVPVLEELQRMAPEERRGSVGARSDSLGPRLDSVASADLVTY